MDETVFALLLDTERARELESERAGQVVIDCVARWADRYRAWDIAALPSTVHEGDASAVPTGGYTGLILLRGQKVMLDASRFQAGPDGPAHGVAAR